MAAKKKAKPAAQKPVADATGGEYAERAHLDNKTPHDVVTFADLVQLGVIKPEQITGK